MAGEFVFIAVVTKFLIGGLDHLAGKL